jgi:hypothetical protein
MNETASDTIIRKSVKDIYDVLKNITGEKEGLFLIDPTFRISDLEGRSFSDTGPMFMPIYKTIAENPRRAWNFNVAETDGTEICQLIYVPNEAINPEGFINGGLTIDNLLTITEETFHAMDKSNKKNRPVREALASLARYYMIRKLDAVDTILSISPDGTPGDITDKSLDLTIYTRQGDASNGYINTHSFCRIDDTDGSISRVRPESQYNLRLYLVGLLNDWQKLPVSEVESDFKRIYENVLTAAHPVEVIKREGFLRSSLPYPN